MATKEFRWIRIGDKNLPATETNDLFEITKMKHRMDWNFKISQVNSFITAASLLAAFSLALFIEYDESEMDKSLKILYYAATTCSFVFCLMSVIIAVGLTRIMGAPDMSNETSQELMSRIKAHELPVGLIGLFCFVLGTESFVFQFAIIALAKISGDVRWIAFSMSLTLMTLIFIYAIYCIRRLRYYSDIIKAENAGYDLLAEEAIGS